MPSQYPRLLDWGVPGPALRGERLQARQSYLWAQPRHYVCVTKSFRFMDADSRAGRNIVGIRILPVWFRAMMTNKNVSRLLFAVVCAAGPARDVGKLVQLAHNRNWDVQIVSTPSALPWLDSSALEAQTQRPIRSEHRPPGSPRSIKPDAIIIAPASFNTINKLANGISDNYALDVVNEMMGLNVPLVILPFINAAYFHRAPFQRSVGHLREECVSVLLGEGGFEPHESGSGDGRKESFPWHAALDAVEKLILTQGSPKPTT